MAHDGTATPASRHRDALQAQRAAEAAQARSAETRLRAQMRAFSATRLVVFVLIVVAILRIPDGASATPAAVLVVLFAIAVVVHGRIRGRHDATRRRRLLAEESGARLRGGVGPGSNAAIPSRPVSALDSAAAVYAPEPESDLLDADALADLGVEGPPPSLLVHLDTTQTLFGGRRLRRMLREPLLDAEAIRARQEAVGELAAERALRDSLMAGFAAARGATLARVPAFLAAPRALHGGALRAAAIACAIVVPVAVAVAIVRFPSFLLLAVAAVAASFIVHGVVMRHLAALRESYLETEPLIRLALALAVPLAAVKPRSAMLAALRAELTGDAGRPGLGSGALRRALAVLHLHEMGALYPVIELLTTWELNALFVLEARVKTDGARWERIAGALGELEALCALAIDADERQPGPWPDILAGKPYLEIEAGVHPLLDSATAIANDAVLGGDARVAFVTGSNMAGKSTFLRMVALHAVLAQAGAAMRARRVRLTPLRVRALISVRDSLADGKSYFLVEVERVRELLALADRDPGVLGVVDELFRGTNSVERVAASRAIARHLARSGGLFLVATHDQDLARLAGTLEGAVAWHFEDEIQSGTLRFPYRLRPGRSAAHNALKLLELAGYPEQLVAEARREAETRWQQEEKD